MSNGRITEVLWYAEHYMTKRIFFTSPQSTLPPGYNRHSTSSPKEMDRLFTRMHEQEREHNEKQIEQIYNRGREYYERCRGELKSRLASAGTSNVEKNIIRASLKLMDDKDSKMQENHVYGISALQESPAPLEGPRTKVTVN